MKKLIIILIFILLQNVDAHLQKTHQRITIEAYELLKLYQGGDIIEMRNHLGAMVDISDGPWKTGLILTGAFREDTEDVVFKYSNLNPPTVTGPDGAISNAALFFIGLFT